MFHYDYKTENTCSQVISLDLDGNNIFGSTFEGYVTACFQKA